MTPLNQYHNRTKLVRTFRGYSICLEANRGHTPCFGSRTVLYSPEMSCSLGEKSILDSNTMFLLFNHTSLLGFPNQEEQC